MNLQPNALPGLVLRPEFTEIKASLNERLQIELDSHWYDIQGIPTPIPSVTTILGIINKAEILLPWAERTVAQKTFSLIQQYPPPNSPTKLELTNWIQPILHTAQNWPNQLTQIASDAGNLVHNATEQHLKGTPLELLTQQTKTAVQTAVKFLQTQDLIPLDAEFLCWDPNLFYAGTIDCVALHPDQTLAVIDWKTGRQIYEEHHYQVAAYAKALQKMTGTRVSHAYVVKLPRPDQSASAFRFIEVKDIDLEYDTFLASLSLWRRIHRSFQPERLLTEYAQRQ